MPRPSLLLAEHRPIVRDVLVARLEDEGFDITAVAVPPWPDGLDSFAAAIVAPGFPDAGLLSAACERAGAPLLHVEEVDDVGALLDKLEELLVAAAAEKRAGDLDAVLEVRLGRLAATNELTADARTVLKYLDGRRSLREVLEKSELARPRFLETVASLKSAELLQPARPRSGTTMPPRAAESQATHSRTSSSPVASVPQAPVAAPLPVPAPVTTAAPVMEAASKAPVTSVPSVASVPVAEPVAPFIPATRRPEPAPIASATAPPPLPSAPRQGASSVAAIAVTQTPAVAETEPPPLPVRPPVRLVSAEPAPASAPAASRPNPAQSLSAIEAAEEAELARAELADFMTVRKAGTRRKAIGAVAGLLAVVGTGAWLLVSREEAPSAVTAAMPKASVVPTAPPPRPETVAAPEVPAPPTPPADAKPVPAEPPVEVPAAQNLPEPAPSPARPEPTKPEPTRAEAAATEPVKPSPAKAESAKPVETAPDYDALVKKAREAAAKGKWQKAVEGFEAAQRGRPTAAVAFELGRVLFDAEKYPRAREAFLSAVKLDPKRAEAQFYLAVTAQSLGKDAEARRAYETALKVGLSGDRANEARKALKALR